MKFFGFIEISYSWKNEVDTFDREHFSDPPPPHPLLFGHPIYRYLGYLSEDPPPPTPPNLLLRPPLLFETVKQINSK